MLGVMGGLVVGAAIGGVLAQLWGITAPYWFAAIGDLAILVWIWSRIDAIASTRSVPTHREGTA
jgi:predicted MFS family arabinose efflux permease